MGKLVPERRSLGSLASDPAKYRTNAYVIYGVATSVEKVELLAELVPLYEYHHYYRVR